jgi:hypothetical protein
LVQRASLGDLLLAHPILPLNYSGFPGPLTAQVLGEVFSGLLQSEGLAKEAVAAFAVGLGVSAPESPEVFDASNCPVGAILQRELEGAAGAIDVPELVQTLMLTYGLTLELSLFHPLAFVRQRGGQLLLKSGSGLTSRGLGFRCAIAKRDAYAAAVHVPSRELSRVLCHSRARVRRSVRPISRIGKLSKGRQLIRFGAAYYRGPKLPGLG